MASRIVLVTGSTDGIGRATAAGIAAAGHELILHGRDADKGRRVVRELEEKTGSRPDLVIADYAVQDDIRRMAAAIASRYTRLDVLINDAGTYQKTRQLTEEGVELTFAVNYLGPFLLTGLLLPLLERGSRIVTVASSAHFDVDRIDWKNLPHQRRYEPWGAYALSKFADVTFTYALARRMEGSGICANCLHPGVVDTKLSRAAAPGIATINTKEGARTPLYLALSPAVEGISGRYFEEEHPVHSSGLSHDRRVQERLWALAEGLTGLSGIGRTGGAP